MLGSAYKKQRAPKNNIFGTTIAELPAGLWIIFCGILMPLLCLILTTVRFALFWEAAREASDAACQAQTYITGTQSGSPPGATTIAQNTAYNVSTMFSGITIDPDTDVNCYIIITPLASTTSLPPVGPNTGLTTVPDPTVNLYQLRVDVTGQIQPILCLSSQMFGSIPGLTMPFAAKLSMVRVIENPHGLYSPQT